MGKYFFDAISLTNKRSKNMDAILVKEKTINRQNILLCVVCDGVGSTENGSYASSKIISFFHEWFDSLKDLTDLMTELETKIKTFNMLIVNDCKEYNLNSASTLSVFFAFKNKYIVFNLGDSRIYRFSNDLLDKLTEDDININGKLNKYIGQVYLQDIYHKEGFLKNNDIFLVCTDGFYKKLNDETIIENLKTLKTKKIKQTLEHLSNKVILFGENDNISVALIKFRGW